MSVATLLRPARLADAPMLATIHAGGFDRPWSADDISVWLARAEVFAMIAESGGEIVAFGLALAAGDDAELLTIASAQDRRRAGIGRALFRALDAAAADRGLSRWVLEVARNNIPALGLYRGEGFVENGVRPNYYHQQDGRVDALMLARPVGKAGGHTAG